MLANHKRLLAEFGVSAGLVDEGRLDDALANRRSHFEYDRADIFLLAATYAYALTRNHPFQDGNKRLALTVAGVFLELNGFRLDASERDAAAATIALSTRELDEPAFAAWLKESCSPIPALRIIRSRPSGRAHPPSRTRKRRRSSRG